jgi:hypothetical protein
MEQFFVSFSKLGRSVGLLLRVIFVLVASCKREGFVDNTRGTYQTLAPGCQLQHLLTL